MENYELLHGSCNADYAWKVDSSKSTSGVYRHINTEAKFMSPCDATKEAVFLRKICAELDRPLPPVMIRTDFLSRPRLLDNLVHHDLTPHLKTQYHYTREMVADGAFTFEFVVTDTMVTDSLTKDVGRARSRTCLRHIGVQSMQGF